MGFRDLAEILPATAAKPKALPINGTVYDFPGRISAETGALLVAIEKHRGKEAADILGVVDQEQMQRLQDDLLGDAYDRMRAAGVTGEMISHVIATLIMWHLYGEQAAEAVWESAGEAKTPNRVARRASKGSGSKTPSPGSTAGTTSRKPAAKKVSAGRRSSSTGR